MSEEDYRRNLFEKPNFLVLLQYCHDYLGKLANRPRFEGQGDSRSLKTQSGQTEKMTNVGMKQEGGVYTLSFYVRIPYVAEVPVVYQAVATIRSSEGGNTVIRKISVLPGTSITIPGRLINIEVTDTTPEKLPFSDLDTPNANTPYTVWVIAERGTRPLGSKPPTLWGGFFSLTDTSPNNSVTVDIPPDSGVNSVEITAVSGAAGGGTPAMIVEFVGGLTGLFKSYNPAINTGFIPIPAGATQIIIANLSTSNIASASLTWGIDG
jgi:hypothetical protein